MTQSIDGLQSPQGDSKAVSTDPALKALFDTREDRAALEHLLSPLLKTLWTDVLNLLFELFPHKQGDGSAYERIYNAARHRVLRVGNDQVRQLPMILGDFVTVKVRETKAVRYTVKTHGPFNLPLGVKFRDKQK